MKLFELDGFPARVGATDVDGFVEGGVFFLDFGRPLQIKRKFGLITEAVFAPLIHQGEREGGFIIGVHRSEPCFEQVRALWTKHYPTPSPIPQEEIGGLRVIADFAKQFPEHCQPPQSAS